MYGREKRSEVKKNMTEVRDREYEGRDVATIAISDIVTELGEYGFIPYDICTGVGHQSVLCDSLWKPHFGVSLSDSKEEHYVFTISSMAGWDAEYDIQGRGILLKRALDGMDETIGAWALLLNATRIVMGEIRST